jgi:hypothetical protein
MPRLSVSPHPRLVSVAHLPAPEWWASGASLTPPVDPAERQVDEALAACEAEIRRVSLRLVGPASEQVRSRAVLHEGWRLMRSLRHRLRNQDDGLGGAA